MITIYVSAKHAVNRSDRHYVVTVKAKDEPSPVDKVVSANSRARPGRSSPLQRWRSAACVTSSPPTGSLRLEALGRPRCAI